MTDDRARLGLLGACLAASLGLYLALAVVLGSVPAGWTGYVGFSLASAPVFRAFSHVPAITLSQAGFGRAVVGLLAALWAVWIAAALLLRGMSPAHQQRARALVLGGGAVMLALVVVSLPPVLSADLYRQAMFGDMVARHGLNPYETPAGKLAGHALLAFADEPHATTIYGPAYTWLSALAMALVPPRPVAVALMWKGMSAAAALACAVVAGRLAATENDSATAGEVPLWVAWNPLVVIESAGSGHLEPIMMLPALAGLLLVRRERLARGFLLLAVSTLTKWVTGLLIVLTAAWELQRAEPGRRLRVLARLLVPAGLATALLYAPFVSGLGGPGGIHAMALRGSHVFGDPTRNWIPQWAMMACFAVAIAAVAVAVRRRAWTHLVAAAVALMITFILVVVPWIFPWYFVAPVVLSCVLPRNRIGFVCRVGSFGLGATFMIFYAKLVVLP